MNRGGARGAKFPVALNEAPLRGRTDAGSGLKDQDRTWSLKSARLDAGRLSIIGVGARNPELETWNPQNDQ